MRVEKSLIKFHEFFFSFVCIRRGASASVHDGNTIKLTMNDQETRPITSGSEKWVKMWGGGESVETHTQPPARPSAHTESEWRDGDDRERAGNKQLKL